MLTLLPNFPRGANIEVIMRGEIHYRKMDAVSALRRLKKACANARVAEKAALEATASVVNSGVVNRGSPACLFVNCVMEYVESAEFIATMYRRLGRMCIARRWAPHADVLRRTGAFSNHLDDVDDEEYDVAVNTTDNTTEEEDPEWFPPNTLNEHSPATTSSATRVPPG
tara:strand:- start:4271 stop:4777 length:507 start_codon:yes stop_codon:yes gene_type:complete